MQQAHINEKKAVAKRIKKVLNAHGFLASAKTK
jgi:hypothetical protein